MQSTQVQSRPVLSPSDDFDDFEAVAGLELTLGKFGGGDGFAVVLDNDATRQEVLGSQEMFEGTGEVGFDSTIVGDDEGHFVT